MVPGKLKDQPRQENKQQESLDQTKEELKRSLLKDFYKRLMTEEQERQDNSKKRDAPVKANYDDEILHHLGKIWFFLDLKR